MTRTDAERRSERRRRNWILIAVVLGIMFLTSWREMPERLPTPYFDLPTPLVIAHQGGNRLRPGNTFAAFDHALAIGADVLEMDVHAAGDGHLVVIHDATLERTTNGVGAVSEQTLAELKALDAGYHWPYVGKDGEPEFELPADLIGRQPYREQGLSIPTLAEMFERYPDSRMIIEIKPADAVAAAMLCDLLNVYERGELTVVASASDEAMQAFRSACPDVATSASSREVRWFAMLHRVGLLRLFTARALALQIPQAREGMEFMTPELMADAHDLHLHVDFWTLNEPAQMEAALAVGADGIMTDRPDLLLELLAR